MQDMCILAGKCVNALFDSTATHYFVSIKGLGLLLSELQCELVMSTPTSGYVTNISIYVRCLIIVTRRKFKVNMICSPL